MFYYHGLKHEKYFFTAFWRCGVVRRSTIPQKQVIIVIIQAMTFTEQNLDFSQRSK